jgi:Flp pilus assembly protein TadD
MTVLTEPLRRSDRSSSFARAASLSVALCALLMTGCTVGGPQGNGELAGRQSKATAPGDVATLTVVTLAETARASGDPNSAVSFYRRAINLDPTLTKAYIGLGETLLAAGAINEAVTALREAHGMWPNNPVILRDLGLALVAVNQPAAAVEVLNQSIKIEPSARAYGAAGIAQNLLGDSAAADQAFRQGLVLAPDDLDLQNNFGLSLALRGDYDAAIRTLRRVASDPKANARYRLNLALVLGLAGHNEDAAQIARIDLDERSVRSNVAYYALLRGLSPAARAAAILRPGSPLPSTTIAGICDGLPCSAPVLADDKPKAAPTQAVQSAPLAPSPAKTVTAPAARADKAVAKPAKDTKPKTDVAKSTDPVAPAVPPAADAAPKAVEPTPLTKAEETAPAPAPTHAIEPPVAAVPPSSAPAMPPPAWDAPKPLTATDGPAPAAKSDVDKAASSDQDAKPAAENTQSVASTEPSKPAVDAAAPTPKSEEVNAAPIEPPTQPEIVTIPAPEAPVETAAPHAPVLKAAAVATSAVGGHATWLQIASFRNEQNAHAAWHNMANGNKEFDRLFSVRRVDLGAQKGIFYVLRMGPFDSTDRAHDFCTALRDRKIDCFISR